MTYITNPFSSAMQGWECPKCGRVYSPSTPMCMYCPGFLAQRQDTTTTTDNTEWHIITSDTGVYGEPLCPSCKKPAWSIGVATCPDAFHHIS